VRCDCDSERTCNFYLDEQNRYTCSIDNIQSALTSILGTHLLPLNDLNVTRVYVTRSTLRRIPNIFFERFPNLKFLSIKNCSLGVINDQTLNKCGDLVYLEASYNEIYYVGPQSFRNCTNLKTVDLSGNFIEFVDAKMYFYTPTLDAVILAHKPGLNYPLN
jgi:Leucine-rich repeat (LRR) protein